MWRLTRQQTNKQTNKQTNVFGSSMPLGTGAHPAKGTDEGHQMHAHNGLSDLRSLVEAVLTARTGALVRTTSDHFSWVVRDNVVGRPGGGEGVGATRFKPLLKKKWGVCL